MALHKAMTIAGSDTSGGAGMEADLKTFTAMGVYGMTALTVIVAQNPLTLPDSYSSSHGQQYGAFQAQQLSFRACSWL